MECAAWSFIHEITQKPLGVRGGGGRSSSSRKNNNQQPTTTTSQTESVGGLAVGAQLGLGNFPPVGASKIEVNEQEKKGAAASHREE